MNLSTFCSPHCLKALTDKQSVWSGGNCRHRGNMLLASATRAQPYMASSTSTSTIKRANDVRFLRPIGWVTITSCAASYMGITSLSLDLIMPAPRIVQPHVSRSRPGSILGLTITLGLTHILTQPRSITMITVSNNNCYHWPCSDKLQQGSWNGDVCSRNKQFHEPNIVSRSKIWWHYAPPHMFLELETKLSQAKVHFLFRQNYKAK